MVEVRFIDRGPLDTQRQLWEPVVKQKLWCDTKVQDGFVLWSAIYARLQDKVYSCSEVSVSHGAAPEILIGPCYRDTRAFMASEIGEHFAMLVTCRTVTWIASESSHNRNFFSYDPAKDDQGHGE
jgi:hypothetical protein